MTTSPQRQLASRDSATRRGLQADRRISGRARGTQVRNALHKLMATARRFAPHRFGPARLARREATAPGEVLAPIGVTRGSEVLYIGDSHTLLMSRVDQAYPNCDVHARLGQGSAEGLRILDQYLRSRHTVIVFDLATNDVGDPHLFEANLESLRRRIGSRELVLINTWRRDPGNSHHEVNHALGAFTNRHPGRTFLVDWASHVDLHPESLDRVTDHVHFTIEAYRQRVAMTRAAIDSALDRSADRDRADRPGADRDRREI